MIRYFATTDDSPGGRLAFEYLKGLLKIGRVRVLSMSSGMHGPWDPCAGLLMTSISFTSYVNVVCCHPSRWAWTNRIQAPLKAGGVEPIDSAAELYTVGVRNVLLAGDPPSDIRQVLTARRYEAVATPTATACAAWIALGVSPSIVAIPVVDLDALRAAIVP